MDLILIILFLNAGFVAVIFRVTKWYRLKTEDYFYHMLCLNLVVALLFVSKHFSIKANYPISVKFFAALAIVYLMAEPCRKSLLRIIRSAMNKLNY